MVEAASESKGILSEFHPHFFRLPRFYENRSPASAAIAFQEAGGQVTDRPPGNVCTQGYELPVDPALRSRLA